MANQSANPPLRLVPKSSPQSSTFNEDDDEVKEGAVHNSEFGSGSGGGPTDFMEQRVAALEKGFGEIQGLLKELRDGQHAAALSEAKQSGDLNTKLAEFGGKLTNLDTQAVGLRRDLEKLPTEYGVAKIMVFVIGGLGAAALLIKNIWPMLSKAFGP